MEARLGGAKGTELFPRICVGKVSAHMQERPGTCTQNAEVAIVFFLFSFLSSGG